MPTRTKKRMSYNGHYTIRVTDDDICNAIAGDAGNCAIARALKRQHPDASYIRVGRGTISFTLRDQRKRVTLRTSLRALTAQEKLDKGLQVSSSDFPPIRLFMDEAHVEPISFTEADRVRQNIRRAEIRAGKRSVKPMSEKEKDKRRAGRRHA